MNNNIKGIAHTAFTVKDIDVALDFYCNKLGFQKIFTMDLVHNKIDYIKVSENNFIELFYGDGKIPAENIGSYDHMCLEVVDIHALKEQLIKNKVDILHDINMGLDNNYQLWIKDPDNNRIEFMQYGKEALQFEKQK